MFEGPSVRRAFAGGVALSQPAPAFGHRGRPVHVHRPARFELTVDLAEDLFSRRWWRGLATLVLLTTGVAWLAPDLGPIPGGRPAPLGEVEAAQWRGIGISPLAAGSRTGLPMAETDLVEPLALAPERSSIDLFATLAAGDPLTALLGRSGARDSDAATAAALVASAAPAIAPGTTLSLTLGQRGADGARPIKALALRPSLSLRLRVERTNDVLRLIQLPIAVDTTPLRFRGRVGDGLYWSLRAAGVSPASASDYLRALATRIEVGSAVMPDDRFDLVIAHTRAATGENQDGRLLYAGLARSGGASLQMMPWPIAGQLEWTEASGFARSNSSGLAWPVQAPITSTFGMRYHPILHFARMHKGIDFGAHWGQPIVAAADGRVERAGWAGGYGNQVRLAHADGLESSYSHMSRIVAEPGSTVRQGQLIGYVGTTGLSTGPHLHYEVYRGGVAVNPMSVRFAARAQIDGNALAAFRSRMKALLGG